MHRFFAVFAFAAAIAALPFFAPEAAAAQPPVTLESKTLSVTVDPEFPRILQYKLKADGATLDGQPEPVSAVELNGKAEACRVTFKKLGADSAEYRLAFQSSNVEVALRVTVGEDTVELRVTEIRERGAVKVHTFAFPGDALLSSRQPDAAVAAQQMFEYNKGRGDMISKLADAKIETVAGNYFFLSAGALAAGIASNHIDDCNRVRWQVSEDGGGRRCAAQNPVWQYREIDSETVPLPWVKVIVTGDRNGDGKADWQDAAIVCRTLLPKPYGSEFVRTMVADQIAMDFASLAQQPFLRILDEIKKAELVTDGLGQSVLVKGFSAEGHDSANTDYGGHYNQRAGGLGDLTLLLEHAREHNARVGVHVNVTEVYPEAQRYKPEILERDGNGNPKGGWAWLDASHLIDKRKDLLTGNLFAALELMRRELPKLDFVYVDVYGDRGWNAWKLATKLNGMGLPIYTEYSTVFDPWSVWAHNRGEFKHTIVRFLWNSDRDLYGQDAVLRGADHVGFMGWQGERTMNGFLQNTFGRNLPTKYLQNFELLRWTPGREAVFSEGVRSVKEGDTVTVTQDGRTVMTWTGNGSNNRLFVPWDPKSAAKIYIWDETGAEGTWELPPSWKNCTSVYLYKLTDLGRTEETKLPVTGGKLTLKVARSTPYVLYPKAVPAQKPAVWGEGSPVKDPGFDSHGFAFWKPVPAGAEQIRVENMDTGNTRLIISGNGGAAGAVSQQVAGLAAGGSYAASVWVQVKGGRKASLEIQPLGVNSRAVSNYVTRTDVRNRLDSESKLGTNFQRLKVTFTLPPGCTAVALSLKADKGENNSSAEFDDVRLVPVKIPTAAAQHFFYEDFESMDQGWGPFVYDCNGQTQTHLAELHEGVTDDVISGRYSFKMRDEPAGLVVRTLPSFLRLKPYTRYRLALDYIADNDGVYRIVVQGKAGSAKSVCLDKPLAKGRGKLAETFATGGAAEPFLAIVKSKGGGGKLVLDTIIVDELGPAPKPAGAAAEEDDDAPAGRVLLQETFAAPLAGDWRVHLSKQPGTSVAVADGALKIAANANVSAFAERKLPTGTTAVECVLTSGGDKGETWGAGLALFWPGGQALRINLRGPAGRCGVDSTAAAQSITGSFAADSEVALRIRIETDKVTAEARCGEDAWQTLATFPRGKFPGNPEKVRLGKMHGVEGTDDHSDPGAAGSSAFRRIRAWGP